MSNNHFQINCILKKSSVLIIFFAASIVLLLTPLPVAQAQESTDEQRVYETRINLMDVSDVDYANGGYALTFWITLSSDDIDFTKTPPPEIDYVNGRIDEVVYETITEHSYYAKIHGTFFTNMDFRNYPLLSLKLPIIIEPAYDEIDQVIFTNADTPSIIDTDLTVLGLIYQQTTSEYTEHQYPDGEIFSKFAATFEFETPVLSSFLVGIFPILVMGAVVLLSFLVDPLSEIRPEIVTATLIAAVFFHVIDIGEGLPPLEYLTLEDKVMIPLYSLIVFAMVEIAAQRKFSRNDEKKAEAVNKKFRFAIPIVVIVTFVLIWGL